MILNNTANNLNVTTHQKTKKNMLKYYTLAGKMTIYERFKCNLYFLNVIYILFIYEIIIVLYDINLFFI